MSKNTSKKLKTEELFAFSDEMAMMISAGISSLEALTLIKEESTDSAEQELVQKMLDSVATTGSFSIAVKEAGVFPEYFCYMVNVGEKTGKTDEALKALSAHYAREMQISASIRSAISYPLLMVLMMLVIITVLVTKIMPIFERVFESLGSSMEGVSAGFLAVGNFLGHYGFVILLILAVLAVVILVMARKDAGRQKLVNMITKTKRFNSIYTKILTSRFTSALSMTIASGMNINEALDIAGGLVENDAFEKRIDKCKEVFLSNADLGKSLNVAGILNGVYGKMAIVSSRTGDVENVLQTVSDKYQEEANTEINDLIAVVEPTLVIILSVIVGLILLSVMLPLLGIMTGIN